jgi:hypothetical protein
VKAHHLSCGTMRVPTVQTLVSHVLLLETDAGLVLVDTGFELEDIVDPARRLGWFRHVIRPVFSAEETRHGRPDGSGSPGTTCGTSSSRISTWITSAAWLTSLMLRFMPPPRRRGAPRGLRPGWRGSGTGPPQLAHGPKIVEHGPDGEMWRGFAAARELTGAHHPFHDGVRRRRGDRALRCEQPSCGQPPETK